MNCAKCNCYIKDEYTAWYHGYDEDYCACCVDEIIKEWEKKKRIITKLKKWCRTYFYRFRATQRAHKASQQVNKDLMTELREIREELKRR